MFENITINLCLILFAKIYYIKLFHKQYKILIRYSTDQKKSNGEYVFNREIINADIGITPQRFLTVTKTS